MQAIHKAEDTCYQSLCILKTAQRKNREITKHTRLIGSWDSVVPTEMKPPRGSHCRDASTVYNIILLNIIIPHSAPMLNSTSADLQTVWKKPTEALWPSVNYSSHLLLKHPEPKLYFKAKNKTMSPRSIPWICRNNLMWTALTKHKHFRAEYNYIFK